MNLFNQIHSSIVSPPFYRTVSKLTARQVVWFVLRIVLLTATIEAAIHTYQSVSLESGIPRYLSKIMDGIRIHKGELISDKGAIFVPAKAYVRDFVAFISSTSTQYINLPDSSILIDTREEEQRATSVKPFIRLLPRKMEINNGATVVPIEYTSLFGSNGEISFTSPEIKSFLHSNIVAVSSFFLVFYIIKSGADILFALFFLTFAAYIFRKGRKDLAHSLKIASFAISPIAVAHILVAFSMTRMEWTGQAALIVSSVVLFRAIKSTGPRPEESSESNQEMK